MIDNRLLSIVLYPVDVISKLFGCNELSFSFQVLILCLIHWSGGRSINASTWMWSIHWVLLDQPGSLVTVWKIYSYLPLLRVSAPSSEILAVSRLDGGTTATYFYIINIGCAYLNIINIINIVCATWTS